MVVVALHMTCIVKCMDGDLDCFCLLLEASTSHVGQTFILPLKYIGMQSFCY